MSFLEKVKSKLSVIGFLIVVIFGFMLAYSILVPHADLMEGVILEKLYIPSEFKAGPNVLSFRNYRSHDYLIATQSKEQWVALVNTPEGQAMVHCDSLHFKMKEVGDVLHFKKYTGEILGVEYQSHYEEAEESSL